MERAVIGKTGLEVNRLGFGGIPIQIILGLRSIARRMGEGFLPKVGPRRISSEKIFSGGMKDARQRKSVLIQWLAFLFFMPRSFLIFSLGGSRPPLAVSIRP
jgi:hypothetical protein